MRPLSLAFLCLPAFTSAQANITWSTQHAGPFNLGEEALDVATSASGLIAVTGKSTSPLPPGTPPPFFTDVETAVFTSSGAPVWSARWRSQVGTNDLSGDLGNACAFDAQDNLYVVGQAQLPSARRLLLKYSPSGALLWARTYGGLQNATNALNEVVVAGANVYVVGTQTRTAQLGLYDALVARIDPANGHELWATAISDQTPEEDRGQSLRVGASGDVWIAGVTRNDLTALDLFVARLSPAGSVQWIAELDGGLNSGESGGYLALDASQRAFVAGTTGAGAGDTDGMLAAVDPSGAVSWTRVLDGPSAAPSSIDAFHAVEVDALGRVIACGERRDEPTFADAWVVAHDASGNELWNRAWGQLGATEIVRSLRACANGDVACAGVHFGANNERDAIFAALTPSGTLKDELTFTSDVEWANQLARLDDGAFVLAGLSSSNHYALARVDRLTTALCSGDGSGTACPCANSSPAGEQRGCTHSFGLAARLASSGTSRLSADTLVLAGSDMPATASCLYFQGTQLENGGSGSVFGDGLRCAGGVITRIGQKPSTAGASHYPLPGDPAISVRGGVTSPGERSYQAWYRNAASFCTPAAFNLTNGLRVAWVP